MFRKNVSLNTREFLLRLLLPVNKSDIDKRDNENR